MIVYVSAVSWNEKKAYKYFSECEIVTDLINTGFKYTPPE